MIPWGEWRPYAGPNSGFAEIAAGVIPQHAEGGIGYGPMPGLEVPVDGTPTALPAAPRGSLAVRLFDGSYKQYFATASNIYVMTSAYGWTSIDSGRTVTDGYDVSMAHFGSYLLNTDTTDGFKAYNVETPAGNNAVSGAPAAAYIFVCNNVIFALNCDGNNRRFKSSGIGDHTAWKTKGANGKTLEDGGALICGFDLKNGAGVMLQDDAVRGIQFGSGGGSLYSIYKIADGKGSVGARSAKAFDGTVYWLSTDGFYRMRAGGLPEPIGAERVDRWFFEQVATDELVNVQCAIDPYRKIVWWRVNNFSLLGFAWALNGGAGAWFTASVTTTALTSIATSGLLADDWDVVADDQDIVMDSRFFDGGQPVFAALNSDRIFATFTGAPTAHTLRTCVLTNPNTGIGNWITPRSSGEDLLYSVDTSDSLDETMTSSGLTGKVRNGAVPLRFRGLNIRFTEFGSAGDDWSFSNGIDYPKRSQGGPR
jgi:hypothetical protein